MHTLYGNRWSVLSVFLASAKPDLPASVCDFALSAWELSVALSQRSLRQPVDELSLANCVPCRVQCGEGPGSTGRHSCGLETCKSIRCNCYHCGRSLVNIYFETKNVLNVRERRSKLYPVTRRTIKPSASTITCVDIKWQRLSPR